MVQHVAGRMRTFGAALRQARLAWTVALALVAMVPGVAHTAPLPIHTDGVPRFTTVIPDGFAPAPIEHGTDVFAMYRRPSDEVLLVMLRLPGALPQGTHDEALWRAAHQADPFAFVDRAVHFRALGFDIDGARGEATASDERVVRWLAVVPTDEQAIAVLAIAPVDHDAQARAALEMVLASLRGPSNWRTPAGRLIESVARVGLFAAVGICVLYALLLATMFRGRPERAVVVRGAMLTAAGIAWLPVALFWFRQPGFSTHVVGFVLAGVGVVLGAQGLGMIRRRGA